MEEWEQELYKADAWLEKAVDIQSVEMEDLMLRLIYAVKGVGHAQVAQVLYRYHTST